jgi:hypothetical protein
LIINFKKIKMKIVKNLLKEKKDSIENLKINSRHELQVNK